MVDRTAVDLEIIPGIQRGMRQKYSLDDHSHTQSHNSLSKIASAATSVFCDVGGNLENPEEILVYTGRT